MIQSIWERRRLEAFEALERERREREAARAKALQARGVKPGKMPHWSTYPMRKIDGVPMRGKMVHVMRPEQEAGINMNGHTCCGWNQASFLSARTFGLPRHELIPGTDDPVLFCTLADRVSCPVCWDVVNDVATWLDITRNAAKRYEGEFHMAWCQSRYIAACEIPANLSSSTFKLTEFANAVANPITAPLANVCSICLAIFGRLYGPSRPENEYGSYTTNEEAALASRNHPGAIR